MLVDYVMYNIVIVNGIKYNTVILTIIASTHDKPSLYLFIFNINACVRDRESLDANRRSVVYIYHFFVNDYTRPTCAALILL